MCEFSSCVPCSKQQDSVVACRSGLEAGQPGHPAAVVAWDGRSPAPASSRALNNLQPKGCNITNEAMAITSTDNQTASAPTVEVPVANETDPTPADEGEPKPDTSRTPRAATPQAAPPHPNRTRTCAATPQPAPPPHNLRRHPTHNLRRHPKLRRRPNPRRHP